MKLNSSLLHPTRLGLALAITSMASYVAQAHPYASGVTGTNGTGFVSFTMNEAGATVTVTFDDLSTTNLGVLPKGRTNFFLGTHAGYKITCSKLGNGIPFQITSDADPLAVWSTPRGVAVDKNPKIGANFGQVCVGSATTGGRGLGLYLLTADEQTLLKGPIGSGFWSGGGNGPYRIRANDDGTFLVNDFSTPNACLLQFTPDLSSSNLVLAIIGQTAAVNAGIHGDLFGCGIMRGSLAAGNLVLYTFDSGMGAPSDTNCILGPLTSPGSFNCVFQYNIGSGPLPWNKRPDFAYTYGLDGIAELRTEGDIGKDGKIICGFGRANSSNPNLQILRPFLTTNGITGDPVNAAIQNAAKDPTNWVYTGGVTPPFNTPPTGTDPWAGINGSGIQNGTYAGVRVSPDGVYLASGDINNGLTIANLTNGIPNEGTIFGIPNTPATANARGMDWDPADNIWTISSGTALLRCWSLGLTTSCVTSNDWTGTNGTFQLAVPPVQASVATMNATASQNYVNNTVNAGTPIPGVFRISLNTSDTTATGPVTVGFVRAGTAVYTNNYTINTNQTPNGVTITPTSVIFPAGVFSGSNGPNWNVDVKITPTALPVSGPTLSFNFRLLSGTNYSAAAPLNGSIAILNTGPQLLQLSAASPSTLGGMNRGILNDQARFIITRLGDTNGPNNDAVNPIVQRTFTVPNINYFPPATGSNFMAKLGVDFTAGAQNFAGSLPSDGSPGIVIAPGAVTINAMVGNPVKHANTSLTRTNLQVIINLTNVCNTGTTPGCNTNLLSVESLPYQVTTAALTLNEFDNALGGEVVLWSNPLTNSLDSTNWTLVYGSINQGASPTLPLVVSNYDNSANVNGNDYYAWFGKPVNDAANDAGVVVPQSAVMVANNWTSALKVSVNKAQNNLGESGVNLYPQIPGAPWTGSNFMVFQGNYALRFDMFLSLYDFGLNNPTIGTPAREFAAFGINHYGTNVNWRLDINPRADGTGARPINADGEWCSIGAASGSITPADYDMFISPAFINPIFGDIPFNTGTNKYGTNDPTCVTACNIIITNIGNTNLQTIPFTTNGFIGIAFTNAYQSSPGFYTGATNVFGNAGVPNDQQSANNNAVGGGPPAVLTSPQNGIIKNPPFSGINKNGGAPDNAWVDVSLELTRQTNLTLKVAQQPIFNSSITTPIFGTQNPIAAFGGTPMLGYLDPNLNLSDYSAFVYFSNVRIVELSPFIPWTNQPLSLIVTQGTTVSLSSGATFASNPLTNTWYVGTTAGPFPAGSIENGTPTAAIITNVFNATNAVTNLTVTSIQSGTNYISSWSDQAGSITNYLSVVEVIAGPGNKTVNAGVTTNLAVTPTGNAPPTSYQWKRGGTNLVAGTQAGRFSSFGGVTTATLTITNVHPEDAGVYSNLVVNANGSVVAVGTLTVSGAVVNPANQTNLWGSTAQFTVSAAGTPPFTYQWQKGGVNLSDGGNVAGATTSALTLSSITRADQAIYTAGVTNIAGGVISSAGTLTVLVPPPTLATPSLSGGNVVLNFRSTNIFDTTNAFILQGSPYLTNLPPSPFTNIPASFTTNNTGGFQVTVPQPGTSAFFYRLLHVN
ncbi:MAG TPA: immunoglobulin domain-containing protein [Candidatus Binatia bacterium]|jgi:hypothetical protein|nr:immunoglobulin domain-containing protein [Candidatus Binatia bacterium]